MAVNTSTRLGCGNDIDDVWDNISNPPNTHEQTCPDCTAARDSLAGLADATSRTHRDDNTDTQLQTSPLILTRILDVARSEVRRGRRLPLSKALPHQIHADLTVSEQTVAAVVRRAGDRNPLVHIRRCHVEFVEQAHEAPPLDSAVREQAPSDVRLAVSISIDASVSIPHVTQDLRRDLANAVTNEVGINVVNVKIEVEDVHNV